ncbi:MAG TPA: sigma-70 family RNA polymerase sigma factor [Kofleriaceae bacterium]|nr:sigma-70 family RNA polymerase sigma factor [Kofleriaceae bacterium]
MPVEVAQLEQHRAVLTGHCYRMLGSPVDADDAVQETMVRAWRNAERFDGRSSVKTWLYRIATNVCLDALSDRSRRARPLEDGPRGTPDDVLETRPRPHWLEPVPDARVIPPDATPAERAVMRQSIRLAFVAALQHLPPKQRAALLLTEVLGWSVAEVADGLETSVASINSALQRARATLAARHVSLAADAAAPTLTEAERGLAEQFFAAFERYDIEALARLLTDDAVISMPPYTLWMRGLPHITAWLLGPGAACRGSKLVPLAASGGIAFGQYRAGGAEPWAIILLETAGDRIVSLTSFLDTAALFPVFGLPAKLAT